VFFVCFEIDSSQVGWLLVVRCYSAPIVPPQPQHHFMEQRNFSISGVSCLIRGAFAQLLFLEASDTKYAAFQVCIRQLPSTSQTRTFLNVAHNIRS